MAPLTAADCSPDAALVDLLFLAPVAARDSAARRRVVRLGLGGLDVSDAFGNPIRYKHLFVSTWALAPTRLVADAELAVGKLEDTFALLAAKLQAAYRWVLEAQVPFEVLCKVDADTVVRIPTLWDKLLQPLGVEGRKNLYAGFVPPPGSPRTVIRPWTNASAVRAAWRCKQWTPRGLDCLPGKLGAYAVPLAEYNRSHWPAFATGGFYAVGCAALAKMMAAPTPRTHLEDAAMGLRAQAAGVVATHWPQVVELLAAQGRSPASAARALVHQKPETKPTAAVHRVSEEAAARVRRLLQAQAHHARSVSA